MVDNQTNVEDDSSQGTSTGNNMQQVDASNTHSTGNQGRKGYGKNKGNKGYSSYNSSSNPRDWKGATPELNGVLGLKDEGLHHRVNFQVFMEHLEDYILRTFSEMGRYLIVGIKEDKHPGNKHKAIAKPTPLTNEERNDEMEKVIKDQEIKAYVLENMKVKNNYATLFLLVIGNCSDAVISVVKGKQEYKESKAKSKVFWLLEELRKVTSGVNVKDNKYSTLHDAMLIFMTMKQYRDKSKDAYLA